MREQKSIDRINFREGEAHQQKGKKSSACEVQPLKYVLHILRRDQSAMNKVSFVRNGKYIGKLQIG